MTEREFAVASLVQHAMNGDMAAIKLVLQLDREAESVERAARAIEESEWTDEKEKLYERLSKSLQEGLASFEAREGPEEKKIPL